MVEKDELCESGDRIPVARYIQGYALKPMPDEFPWEVRDNSGVLCGYRRTEADAQKLAEMLKKTHPTSVDVFPVKRADRQDHPSRARVAK